MIDVVRCHLCDIGFVVSAVLLSVLSVLIVLFSGISCHEV